MFSYWRKTKPYPRSQSYLISPSFEGLFYVTTLWSWTTFLTANKHFNHKTGHRKNMECIPVDADLLSDSMLIMWSAITVSVYHYRPVLNQEGWLGHGKVGGCCILYNRGTMYELSQAWYIVRKNFKNFWNIQLANRYLKLIGFMPFLIGRTLLINYMWRFQLLLC